jgi:hypothetical protein
MLGMNQVHVVRHLRKEGVAVGERTVRRYLAEKHGIQARL